MVKEMADADGVRRFPSIVEADLRHELRNWSVEASRPSVANRMRPTASSVLVTEPMWIRCSARMCALTLRLL